MTMQDPGLSPRVRGNRDSGSIEQDADRSIPACAGEPRSGPRATPGPRVYPRVCGGTERGPAYHQGAGGLSPRVRGNPVVPGPVVALARSIPACAGEPHSNATGRRGRRVYPRVCGGTDLGGTLDGGQVGLSPRVRGNPNDGYSAYGQSRSIPACAGEPRRRDCGR